MRVVASECQCPEMFIARKLTFHIDSLTTESLHSFFRSVCVVLWSCVPDAPGLFWFESTDVTCPKKTNEGLNQEMEKVLVATGCIKYRSNDWDCVRRVMQMKPGPGKPCEQKASKPRGGFAVVPCLRQKSLDWAVV